MRILRARLAATDPVTQFGSHAAHAVALGHGEGASHAYGVAFEAGGAIGPHPAGFGQLFVVIDGAGWISGPDGLRQAIERGDVAVVEAGELHAKGSDTGMRALMIQMTNLRTD